MNINSIFFNIISGVYHRTGKLFYNPFKKIGFSWLKTKMLKNLPANKLQTVKLYNNEVAFYSREEFIHSINEIFIDEIYKQELPPSPFIIDCGANIGLSVIYLKRLIPDAVIVAFEPDEKNFGLLKKNIDSFGLKDVEVRREAVWIENTSLNFKSEGTLASKIQDGFSGNSVLVTATRLKDLMIREIAFLKIDIEGAEYKVLKDIEPNLDLVKNIFVEYHGTFQQNNELEEIIAILHSKGFNYYIKEASNKHPTPFFKTQSPDYDLQLNIFGFRSN